MNLTETVKGLVRERAQRLAADNEYLTRQIQFQSQRVDDLKAQLKLNVEEVQILNQFLSNIEPVTRYDRNADTLSRMAFPDTTGGQHAARDIGGDGGGWGQINDKKD